MVASTGWRSTGESGMALLVLVWGGLGLAELIWSDFLSRGMVRRPSGWFPGGRLVGFVGWPVVGVSTTRDQADMRGSVTAGRGVRQERDRVSRNERRQPVRGGCS